MGTSGKKVKIAVSACLLGHNVRYDGGNKDNSSIHKICESFECVPICPESAVGLGTPRPPMELIKHKGVVNARGKTNPNFDATSKLRNYANKVSDTHKDLCGYIFKSRSPSCGLSSTPWIDIETGETGLAGGIFSGEIIKHLPGLPVIEETQLDDSASQNAFIMEVEKYAGQLKEKE